jgi:heme/copper-type cytochrome/quinol oxidase subunit 2
MGGCGLFNFSGKKAQENPDLDLKGKVPFKVTIAARKYSFRPDIIRVKEGVPLEITLKSEDVAHGFGIRRPGSTQNFGAFDQEKPLIVLIRTDKKEIIEFFSTVYSGVDYYKMKGQIIVE